MPMLRMLVLSASLLLFVLVWSTPAVAQTTATLSGIATDASGAVLPGTQITVTNTSTGVQRSLTADTAGRFLVSQLPPGPYEVTGTLSGFETLVRRGITLEVGQEANLTLAMKVGAVAEQITVTGEAPMVNTSTSEVAGVVDEQRIQELPLNGRDFSQLPLVQPGVAAARQGSTSSSKGYGTRVAMGGSRPDQTAWLLDGTDIRNGSNFGTPGSAAGVMLGVDAVREFQVLTSNYSAEVGRSSGGVVNMVTRSGTNSLHGSVFEFLRNSDLDARNFFDQAKPAFKRNQFGGSLGGPFKKDRTFFFGNYEGLRQRQGVTQVATAPDANIHQGLITAPGGGLQQVEVAPEIRPYLDLWPLPNGPSAGGGIATLYAPASNPADENYFIVRVDHHINEKQTLFARVTFDQGNIIVPDPLPVFESVVDVHSRLSTVQHQYIVTPHFLMITSIAFNRTLLSGNELPLINYSPSLNLFLTGYLPQLSFPGVTILGPSATNLLVRVQNLYDFHESFQYIHGGHSIKFGAQVDHMGFNENNAAAGQNGTFTWSTPQAFLLDNRLQTFNAVAIGSTTQRSLGQYLLGFYFQDDWKMKPNFTWNLGLRYSPTSAPTEKYGRISTLINPLTATAFTTGILYNSPDMKDFSPRVGFAWDPKGDGKTAVRAGFGIFFAVPTTAYYGTPATKNAPFLGSTTSVLGNLASAVSDMARISPALLSATTNPNDLCECITYHLNPSYEMKFSFAVERQLPGDLSLAVGYLGARGVHLWRQTDGNDPIPISVNGRPLVMAGTPRPNSTMGQVSLRLSDVQSFYNGLQIEVKKRFTHGFQFQTAYTWSKNVDDATGSFATSDYGQAAYTVQPWNPKSDRGLSNLNQGQTLVVNGIYNLPAPAHSGFVSTLLGGWQIASIFTVDSGSPFSPLLSGRSAPDMSRQILQRPDLVADSSFSSLVTGNPNHYINLTPFILPPPAPAGYPAGSGFYGNAARNILVGPGLVDFDFSLHKSTPLRIREGSQLEFHADFFNLINRANFGNPATAQTSVLNPSTGAYVPGAGQITNTVTSSRQIQFGLKLIF